MPSETYLNMTQGISDKLGFNPEVMLILFAVIISVTMAVAVTQAFQKKGVGHSKELGIVIFFSMLGFMAFIEVISWLIVIVPLFLVGMLMYYRREKAGAD